MVVVNKPAGLLSIPDREGSEISLKEILKNRYGNIFTVHRLDRETSGVIVFAKDEASHKFLSAAFEGRDVEKYYAGIVARYYPRKERHYQ
jgi:Pseudouridylate synthases, 23S RNA-specific